MKHEIILGERLKCGVVAKDCSYCEKGNILQWSLIKLKPGLICAKGKKIKTFKIRGVKYGCCESGPKKRKLLHFQINMNFFTKLLMFRSN